MNVIRDKVEKLPLNTILQCIDDYEEFEKTGKLGDVRFRKLCEEMAALTSNTTATSMWFEVVAKEIFRTLAYRYIAFRSGQAL